MREFEISDDIKKILNKLYKKEKVRYDELMKKIEEVITTENQNQ